MIASILFVISYLIGSIPFGLYIGKIFCSVDLREVGSGNIGATNAWRVLGWQYGLPIFILDLAKGLVPVLIARFGVVTQADVYAQDDNTGYHLANHGALQHGLSGWGIVACGIAAILGHNFSPFLKFKGGKGVATSLGVCIGMSWEAGIAGFAVWGVLVLLTRYVSIGSIVGTAVGSIGIWLNNGKSLPFGLFGIIATLFVAVKHKANIQRLLNGIEPKVDFGRKHREESNESAESQEK